MDAIVPALSKDPSSPAKIAHFLFFSFFFSSLAGNHYPERTIRAFRRRSFSLLPGGKTTQVVLVLFFPLFFLEQGSLRLFQPSNFFMRPSFLFSSNETSLFSPPRRENGTSRRLSPLLLARDTTFSLTRASTSSAPTPSSSRQAKFPLLFRSRCYPSRDPGEVSFPFL